MTALELDEAQAWMPEAASARRWPGPMVRKLLLLALLGMLLSALLAAALVSRQQGEQTRLRQQQQQSAEVQLVARLLASRLEQSQKILAAVADGIDPQMLESPLALEWLLQQGLPAVRFFDVIVVARQDGALSVNLRYGQLQTASDIDPAERAELRRTLTEGKPQVSGLTGSNASDARLLLTMPLLHQGRVVGAVAGVLRLQAPGVLPYALAMPERAGARWVVFSREGVILAHPDAQRVFGLVQDEPGLSQAYEQWRTQEADNGEVPVLRTASGHVVSLATVALPQWLVARVHDERAAAGLSWRELSASGWQAGAAVALWCALVLALLWRVSRPLTQLHAQAQMLLATNADVGADADAKGASSAWPQAPGEVDALVQLCLRWQQNAQQQQASQGLLAWQLAAVLAHMPQALILTRADVVQASSAQAHRLLGYAGPALEQALDGQPLLGLLAQEQLTQSLECLQQQVQAQFRALDVFDAELPVRRRDGSVLWVRVQAQPVTPGAPEQGVLWLLEECAAARQARQQHAWEELHDALTELPNRQGLLRRLQQWLDVSLDVSVDASVDDSKSKTIAASVEQTGVLLFLDVDSFHLFNQQAGAAAGDEVLRHLARLIRAVVRSAGWAARLEGDQFVVVLPACSMARGAELAEQLRTAVQGWEPVYQGLRYGLGLSVGQVPLAAYGRDVNALLHAADMACYQAKRSGRHQAFGQQWAA